MRFLLALPLLALLSFFPALADTVASDRMALVIGMSNYQTVPKLRNTINDANALADTLESIGFEVDTLIDAPRSSLQYSISRIYRHTQLCYVTYIKRERFQTGEL